jgi:Flp pilus assembly protein TadD
VNHQDDPGTRFVQIKKQIDEGRLEQAEQYIRTTLSDFPERPEPYNLLGAVMEIKSRWLEAVKFYRAALDLDPTYKPAITNLDRATSFARIGRIVLEEPLSRPDSLPGDRRQTL